MVVVAVVVVVSGGVSDGGVSDCGCDDFGGRSGVDGSTERMQAIMMVKGC